MKGNISRSIAGATGERCCVQYRERSCPYAPNAPISHNVTRRSNCPGRTIRRIWTLATVCDSEPSLPRGPDPLGYDSAFSRVAMAIQTRGDNQSACTLRWFSYISAAYFDVAGNARVRSDPARAFVRSLSLVLGWLPTRPAMGRRRSNPVDRLVGVHSGLYCRCISATRTHWILTLWLRALGLCDRLSF
jgi:hypothetical protein